MIIMICVGSSCCLKGSYELVELFKKAIAEHGLEDDVTLAGNFCTGNCNRIGVTIQIDDNTYTGVTPAGFDAFFKEHVLIPFGKTDKGNTGKEHQPCPTVSDSRNQTAKTATNVSATAP